MKCLWCGEKGLKQTDTHSYQGANRKCICVYCCEHPFMEWAASNLPECGRVVEQVNLYLDCQKWHQVKKQYSKKNTAFSSMMRPGRVYGVIQICGRYKSDVVIRNQTRVTEKYQRGYVLCPFTFVKKQSKKKRNSRRFQLYWNRVHHQHITVPFRTYQQWEKQSEAGRGASAAKEATFFGTKKRMWGSKKVLLEVDDVSPQPAQQSHCCPQH